jgi:cytochrome c-type biogenesis protein
MPTGSDQSVTTVLHVVNEWMTAGHLLAAAGCFLWGMISAALSPCHIAPIPLMVSYVAGQDRAPTPRHAVQYALAFTSGLFLTIAVVGVLCSLLGRMLGDIGLCWTILVGAILIWVALELVGVTACSLGGGLVSRLRCQGRSGAFVLGLAYGALSGSCTFGCIAPILALITVQQEAARGILFILVFGLGPRCPWPCSAPPSRWCGGSWTTVRPGRGASGSGGWPEQPSGSWARTSSSDPSWGHSGIRRSAVREGGEAYGSRRR